MELIKEEFDLESNWKDGIVPRGGSAALGWRMPWATRLFLKSMKEKILNFLQCGPQEVAEIKYLFPPSTI